MLECDPVTGYLPAGEHRASLDEIAEAFAWNFRRREILTGLTWVVGELLQRGVTTIWIDGSFVTADPRPQDVDVVFVPEGADTSGWNLLSFARQKELKKLRRVHLWPHPSPQTRKRGGVGTVPLVEWFKSDEDDIAKGIVLLDSSVQSGDIEAGEGTETTKEGS
jgi:hypothetical protein